MPLNNKSVNLCVRILDGRLTLVSAMAKPTAGAPLSTAETVAISLQSAARAVGCELAFVPALIPSIHMAQRLLDPEDLGYTATKEIRDIAREVLGVTKNEFLPVPAGVVG